MPKPRIRRPAPDGDTITTWQGGWMRLVDLGDGRAAVVVTSGGQQIYAADITHGTDPTRITWTDEGCMEIEQYKRDAWDTRIYSAIARWRAAR